MKIVNKTLACFSSFLVPLSMILISSCNGSKLSTEKEMTPSTLSDRVVCKIPLPINGFSNGYLDKDGSIWFSSNGGGVFHYNGHSFKNYTVEDGLSSNKVFSIISDKNDNLWFGTQNGLIKYDRKQFKHIKLPFQDTTSGWIAKVSPVLNPNAAHSLAIDNNNNVWIGTAGGGAYKYDGEKFISYLTEIGWKQEDSLYHNWIPFIQKDSKGNMWFASMTHGGVSKYDGSFFTQYLPEDGLNDDMVRTIFEDSNGTLWFGFNGNRNCGITRLDGHSFKTYSIENHGLCNERIRAIFEDKNGHLWLGADRGNLCIFDGKKFSEFNYEGADFSNVLFIFSDMEDNIWFGGKDGIWKFDGKKINEITTNR